MKKIIFFFIFFLLPSLSFAQNTSDSEQLIIVKTPDWNSVAGILQRYDKRNGKWEKTGKAISIVVGKKGLGWGRGLKASNATDPIKKEGDLKSPAGSFKLGSSMGYAKLGPGPMKWAYEDIEEDSTCIEDPDSKFYNQIVHANTVTPDWKSKDLLKRKDNLYERLIVVEANSNPVEKGSGSCIFLHVWRGPASGTAGCTAMEIKDIENILQWLDPQKKPILVQLPESEYKKYQSTWSLPYSQVHNLDYSRGLVSTTGLADSPVGPSSK